MLDRLQSVLNAAARSTEDGSTTLLLHCFRACTGCECPERIRLAVLVFRCRNNTAPAYLARDLHWAADNNSRQRLRSSTTHKLIVPRTRLRIVGDRTFGVTAARVWNNLSLTVRSATSLNTFKRHLKTHLFHCSYSC